jgi:hypothetical protein
MRTVKGWIATTFLALSLVVSTVPANAGVIIGGFAENKPQTCEQSATAQMKTGVIIGGFTVGVIIGGVIGVIIGGFSNDREATNCGVIIGG